MVLSLPSAQTLFESNRTVPFDKSGSPDIFGCGSGGSGVGAGSGGSGVGSGSGSGSGGISGSLS